eukprot:CAMPEP_0114489740 /NCGR_PEP_ID=MMETSP0109-20121206/2054_1 /TAXON_ID=29199 /ORGANISM="Chlorarachnion reptans, Strain CCCM449" /LENGTH=165 /DNA_ID=CAMNT_0001666279 /DNA_START=198 /DNA_END=695 /DNA_ORIENTATION=-
MEPVAGVSNTPLITTIFVAYRKASFGIKWICDKRVPSKRSVDSYLVGSSSFDVRFHHRCVCLAVGLDYPELRPRWAAVLTVCINASVWSRCHRSDGRFNIEHLFLNNPLHQGAVYLRHFAFLEVLRKPHPRTMVLCAQQHSRRAPSQAVDGTGGRVELLEHAEHG